VNALIEQCSVCPRLCRHACPVATATGREAAVPSLIASAIHAWSRGWLSPELAGNAASLCVDCDACREACHLHADLPGELRAVRRRLLRPAPMEPLGPIEGDAELVVIEADTRSFAAALGQVLGVPVARLRTADALGVHAIDSALWPARVHALRSKLKSRSLVTADGGVVRALTSAALPVRWLHELVDLHQPVRDSCASNGAAEGLRCCGGAGPLAAEHPADAERMARVWAAAQPDAPVADARCAGLCRRAGAPVVDAIDLLLLRLGTPQEAP